MGKQFADVHAPHGAPMGRPDYVDNPDAEVRLFKVIFVDGDYDDGGAYWGGGTGNDNLYCARGDGVETFYRAKDWHLAKALLMEDHPDLKVKREFDIELMLHGYLVCALWSSTDVHGDDIDSKAGVGDIRPTGVQRAREDCEGFVSLCEENQIDLLAVPGMDEEGIGHDFWLTRNGHGAGFWDRGLGQLGDYLTKWAKTFGEAYADLDEDGKVTIE